MLAYSGSNVRIQQFINHYLIFTASMPSESDIPIHTFSNFTKVSK